MDYSLNSNDIIKCVGSKNVKILLYDDIHKYSSIDALFFDESDGLMKSNIALLYIFKELPSGGIYGHWTSLLKYDDIKPYGEPTILYFDSYGDTIPDEILDKIPLDVRIKYKENHTYLSRLLVDQGKYELEYNEVPLQKKNPNITTCGRWVCAMILFRFLTIDQFDLLFSPSKKFTPDDLVLYTVNVS